MCEETKAKEVKRLAPGFMYTPGPYLEKDVFSREEDSCLYKQHSDDSDCLYPWAQEEERMNTHCPTPANGPLDIDSLRNRPPGGRMPCLSCWPSHIMFMGMKNHLSKLAFVQMIAQFLQACCVPLIGPSFNYEVTISQCSSIISLFLLCWQYRQIFSSSFWNQTYQHEMVVEITEGK